MSAGSSTVVFVFVCVAALLAGCVLPKVQERAADAGRKVSPSRWSSDAGNRETAKGRDPEPTSGASGTHAAEDSSVAAAAGMATGGAGGEMRSCSCAEQNECCDGCQPRQDAIACKDDGLECTKDVCRAGTCAHEFATTSECLIAGECYANMQNNPQNPCQRCDVARTQSAWSEAAGMRCDDGVFCNGTDTCDSSGRCWNHTGDPCAKGTDTCIVCDEQQHGCIVDSKATMYDAPTDLLWEVVPAQPDVAWQAALDTCAALTFCGRDDWRLPQISELRNLLVGCPSTEVGGSCGVRDTCLAANCQGDDCFPDSCESKDVGGYLKPGLTPSNAGCDWSSDTVSDVPERIWTACYRGGNVLYSDKDANTAAARCVRTGRLP